MAENHRKWSDVIGKGESISSRPGLGAEGGLDYDHNKLAVGFDYASHCHGWESCLIIRFFSVWLRARTAML